MKSYSFLCLLSAAVLFSACRTDDVTSSSALLSVEKVTVSVKSDAALEQDPFSDEKASVTDTVWVNSSRSWTAVVKTDDGGDWIHASVKERINVTNSLEKYPLLVSFDRYRGSQPRTASLTLYGVDIEEPVVIRYTQEAYTPTLELSAPDGAGIVAATGSEVYAIVKSNTNWTAKIDESVSTVIPGLSAVAGSDSKAIMLSFPESVDDEKALIARLVVKASGLPTQTLDFIQTQSERFFLLASPVEEVRPPYESEVHIPLRSNGPWTAEITDCSFQNAELIPAAGQQALDGITFTADHGADPEVEQKQATIKIRREGYEPLVVKISQRGSIHLKFITRDPEYEFNGTDPFDINTPYRPYKSAGTVFAYPTSFPSSLSNGTYKGQEVECGTKAGDYIFTAYGQDCGVWLSSNEFGFCVGKMKGDYVLFPAFEEYRLSEMYYEASCRAATPYTVRTEEGDVIEGGELTWTSQVFPLETEHHDVHVHRFPSTRYGEHYRLSLEETYRFISIKELCLVYEK